MQEVNDCFNKIKKDCFKFISSQETKKDKFKNKDGKSIDFIQSFHKGLLNYSYYF